MEKAYEKMLTIGKGKRRKKILKGSELSGRAKYRHGMKKEHKCTSERDHWRSERGGGEIRGIPLPYRKILATPLIGMVNMLFWVLEMKFLGTRIVILDTKS